MTEINRSQRSEFASYPDDLACTEPDTSGPTNSVSTFRRPANEDVAVNGDSTLEANLRERFAQLEPGQSLELSAEAGYQAYGFNGKVKVERQDDGSFLVEVEASANTKVGGDKASGKAAIAAGTTFHVSNAAEAADLTDALTKSAFVTAADVGQPVVSLALKLRELFIKDDLSDSHVRLAKYSDRISQLKGAVTASQTLGSKKSGLEFKVGEANFLDASGSIAANQKQELKVDLEKGELTLNTSLDVSASAQFKALALSAGGGVKGTQTLSLKYKLTGEMKQRLADGTLSAADALKELSRSARTPKVSMRVEIELSGKGTAALAGGELKGKASTEWALDFSKLRGGAPAAELFAEAATRTWKVEGEAAYGASVGVDAKFVRGEVQAFKRHKWADSDTASLGDALRAVRSIVADDDSHQLTALRARSNPH